MDFPVRTFSSHYRERYGEPVGKIPLDNGYPCPNGHKDGCIFCLPRSYSAEYLDGKNSVYAQIKMGKKSFLGGRFRLYFAYYQQGTCTVAPVSELLEQAEKILADQDCVGIIFSTRPDCVPDGLLDPLAELVKRRGKECHFELGLQSIHQKSLAFLNRNHTARDFEHALLRLNERKVFQTGAHLIFGIPGETISDMLNSLKYVCDLQIETLKFHHLQVLRHTRLAQIHEKEGFDLFDRKTYMDFLLKALPVVPRQTIIHRLWAHAHPDLLVAPRWNILPTVLSRELYARMRKEGVTQGCQVISTFSGDKKRQNCREERERGRSGAELSEGKGQTALHPSGSA